MKPNCKECKHNNNGWCKRFKLQKPQAVIVCESLNDFKGVDITETKTENTGIQFTQKEKALLIGLLNYEIMVKERRIDYHIDYEPDNKDKIEKYENSIVEMEDIISKIMEGEF